MRLQQRNYLDKKLIEAKNLVNKILGYKELYTQEDVYELLNAFTFTQEIDFSELHEFLPSAMKKPESIEEYTKGFIYNDDYKIYALNYGTGYVIIVVDGKEYAKGYYGDTINDFTLNIFYCLEIMCKNLTN